MLVLARALNDNTVVTDLQTGQIILQVKVVDLRHNRVQLGFIADPDRYKIMREEAIIPPDEGEKRDEQAQGTGGH